MATTLIQSNADDDETVSSLSSVTAGNVILVGVNASVINDIVLNADIGGSAMTLEIIEDVLTNNSQRVVLAWEIAHTTGTFNLQIQDSLGAGMNFMGTLFAEWEPSGTVVLHDHATAHETGVSPGTDAFTCPSVAVDTENELVVGLIGTDTGGLGDYTAGTGASLVTQTPLQSSGADRLALEFAIRDSSIALPWSTAFGFNGQKHAASFKFLTETPVTDEAPYRHNVTPMRFR